MSEYGYQPLSSTGNIRILKVFKSRRPDDPLEGELIERPLDKARPTYEAVSYTWGGQNADHFILLGGKRLPITKNCSELIHNFRNPKFLEATSVRRLWIDSICINQKDGVEKATQIEMMDRIYARSAQVLIWLGPSTAESDRLFELVRLWAKRAWNPFMGKKRKNREEDAFEVELQENPNMVLDVISRPWFTRVWTLQESSASQWAVLRSGRQKMLMGSLFTLSDYAFAGATRFYHNIPVILEHMERFSLHFRTRITLNKAFGDYIPMGYANDLSITETMRDIRKCGAFEPRDRIFALHAICRRANINLPPADYKRTVNEVYHTATLMFLQSISQASGAIQILLLATGRDITRQDAHVLPSWVPDYADTVPPWLVVDHKNSAHLNEMPSDFRFSLDNMRLSMPAVVIDRIAEASTQTPWHPDRIMQVGEDIVWETLQGNSDQTVRALQDWARIAKQLPFGCFQLAHSMRAAFFATIGAHRGEMNIYEQVGRARTACPSAEDMLAMEERITNIIGEDITTELFNDAYEQDFEADAKLWWSLLLANDAANDGLTMECLPAILEHSPADTLLLKKFSTRFNASSISARSDEYKILLTLSTLFPGISESLLTACRGNTFFRTDGGYMGAGTSSLRDGDLIVLVGGLFCPIAVRPLGRQEDGYKLIGPAYVHGVMKGELWGKMRRVFQEKEPKLGDPAAMMHGVSRYYSDLELV